MSSTSVIIRELVRVPARGAEDTILFHTGVNVVVGPPNAGKTQLLRMLDYLFGDPDSPEETFGEDLAQKYDEIRASVTVGDQDLLIERRWKQPGVKTKVFVDGEAMSTTGFQEYLLNKLDIPFVHYPSGNPYGARNWPFLGWRSLYRHIYRRQNFWGDIADKQPDSEQHACLLQFLGLAEQQYSPDYEEMVAKEKEVAKLQAQKEQFLDLLHDISRDIVDNENLSIALTPESVDSAVQDIRGNIDLLYEERAELLRSLLTRVSSGTSDHRIVSNKTEQLCSELVRLQADQQSVLTEIDRTKRRLAEVTDYHDIVATELARLERARIAGTSLGDLRVTHCPACDRELDSTNQAGVCELCRRPLPVEGDLLGTEQRLDFEIEQLNSDLHETDELIVVIRSELDNLKSTQNQVMESINGLNEMLEPTRTAAVAILPSEVVYIDVQVGRLQEKVRQLERIKEILSKREMYTHQIRDLEQRINDLGVVVSTSRRDSDFEGPSDKLSDLMNEYLNDLNTFVASAWSQEEIRARIRENNFSFTVGGRNWSSKLGGTLVIYFLLAYHYALLGLTRRPEYHYPGLTILDFPAEVEGAQWRSDRESFVLMPFVRLLSRVDMQGAQLIAAGSSFDNLVGAHRIELDCVWK